MDFKGYIAALERAGFAGYLTIERETGADPIADIKATKSVIGKILYERKRKV